MSSYPIANPAVALDRYNQGLVTLARTHPNTAACIVSWQNYVSPWLLKLLTDGIELKVAGEIVKKGIRTDIPNSSQLKDMVTSCVKALGEGN